MTLNEFQKQTLKAIGSEGQIEQFENNENLSNLILPKSPLAQGLKHAMGGLSHTIDLVAGIVEDDMEGAENLLAQLRTQVTESTRGVAKDALPILQSLGLIEEFFEGDLTVPDEFDVERVQEDLEQRHFVASAGYRREQYPDSPPLTLDGYQSPGRLSKATFPFDTSK